MPGGGSGSIIMDTRIPTKYALAVQFGILSEERVKKMSVAEIDNDAGWDKSTNKPAAGGTDDPRMGTNDRDTFCETCGCDYNDCPGHFGCITLRKPVYHPGYMTYIHKVLRCICFSCSRLRLRDREILNKIKRLRSPHMRFKFIYMYCQKIKECRQVEPCDDWPSGIGCTQPQPTWTKDGLQIIKRVEIAKGAGANIATTDPRSVMKPEDVMRIFKAIPDEDVRLMGMDPRWARPEGMIIKCLAVAPPPVRPSVEAGDGMRSNDDLTYAYKQIIRTNNELKKLTKVATTEKAQADVVRNLQLLVATLMDNNQPDQPKQQHVSGRPIKCIRSRLKSKEGRVRGNLMGKRVDFSARTVITPDPILQLDQLGVPEMIAMNLTVPEYVTRANFNTMRQLVKNGPHKWPGAKYIIRRSDNKQRDLAYMRHNTDAHLDIGYIVERHLRDGDYVIFNRQPSLHKMSLMGHRVKVLPFQTFRLNLSVTSPYNADFDGDEMNMHVPQSYETMAEIKEIMAVPRQVVAPKDNKPVMGIVQDSLLGIMLMTLRDNFLTLDQVMNLLMWFDYEKKKVIRDGRLPPPAILKPGPLWTGKQILSLVLPEVNYSAKENKDTWACPNDSNVLVKQGELLCGVMKKKQVGAQAGGLVHITWRDLGTEACKIFLSDTQNLVNNWLVGNGFSVGVQDIVAEQGTVDRIQEELKRLGRKVQRIMQRTQRGQLKTLPGKGMQESFEHEVLTALGDAIKTAGNLTHKNLPSWNRLSNMVTSGSKGSQSNISQIMACCGQQNVEGQRIRFGFHRRSLPHFSKDDFGLDSKGFVSSCYFFGLTPQEFYFHAMGGREGLIDTACKTAETGYIQRRLIKTLEDVQVKYDMTVRTAKDQIIQFLYGEDGMSAEFIENQGIPMLKFNNKQMDKNYRFFKENSEAQEKKMVLKDCIYEDVVQMMEEDDEAFDKLQSTLNTEYEQLMKDRESLRSFIFKSGETAVALPVNVPRLLWNAKERFNINSKSKTELEPSYVVNVVRDLLDSQKDDSITVYQQKRLNDSPLFESANEDATWLMKIYLRSILSSKNIVQNQRLDKDSFDWLVGEIRERFRNSLCHPGEMIGSIGAQSIGEPATQMTLNTFHMAGVASKNVTQGVPRLKEIINVATTIKTPSLRIMLTEEFRKSQEATREVGNTIEYTNLGQVVASSALYYDPDPEKTIVKADQALVDFYNDTYDDDEKDGERSVSPWLIRFEIENAKLDGKGLTLKKIDESIRAAFCESPIEIVRSFDTEKAKKLVLRLRPPDLSDDEGSVPVRLKEFEEILLNQLALKGFEEITKVSYSNKTAASSIIYYDENGAQQRSVDNWIIETDGVALKKVMAVENVDYAEVMSNNIQEILYTLGIEAARAGLLEELNMILGSYGVNHRHMATLVDIMTTRGKLMSITRHGINRVDDAGALRKCSFEETVEILLEASFHAEVDPLAGVTENIIMGQLAPYGTGAFEVMMDCQKLHEGQVQKNYLQSSERVNQFEEDIYRPQDGGDTIRFPDTPQQPGQGIANVFTPGGTEYDMNNVFTPGPAQSVYPTGVDSSYPGIGTTPGIMTSSPIPGGYNSMGDSSGIVRTNTAAGTGGGGYSHDKGATSGGATGSGPFGLYGQSSNVPTTPFGGGRGASGAYSPIPGMGGAGASPRAGYGSGTINSPIHNPTAAMGGMGGYGSGMQTPIAGPNTSGYQQYVYRGTGGPTTGLYGAGATPGSPMVGGAMSQQPGASGQGGPTPGGQQQQDDSDAQWGGTKQ